MTKKYYNKITKFNVGDIVQLKSNDTKIVLTSRWDNDKVDYVSWTAHTFGNSAEEFKVRESDCYIKQ